MQNLTILVIGGGIGGLISAIALRKRGFAVDVIEKDPHWAVYGVGIIQQSNVVRAMADLDLIDDYLDAGFGFDQVEVFAPNGVRVAAMPTPKLVAKYPGNVGISRPALHKVLGDRTKAAGANVRLGITAQTLEDDGTQVSVVFSDGSRGVYDIVVGADGLYSTTRPTLFPDAPGPEFTGQSVWRYNLPRPDDVVNLSSYDGPIGVGLVPLSASLMYLYVTTPEPGNPRYPHDGLAAAMRSKLEGQAPAIAALAEQITDDDAVVYKPLEWLFLEGDWHKGRIVLLGDAVHTTPPHLGQGAGMAIEDGIVLAEELAKNSTPEAAFTAFHARRVERCRFIVERSLAICFGQLGRAPLPDYVTANRDMFKVIAQPI